MSKSLAATLIAGAVALTLVDLRTQSTGERIGASSGSFQFAQQQCPKGKRYDYQSDSCK
jgi:hypothetical protein